MSVQNEQTIDNMNEVLNSIRIVYILFVYLLLKYNRSVTVICLAIIPFLNIPSHIT